LRHAKPSCRKGENVRSKRVARKKVGKMAGGEDLGNELQDLKKKRLGVV